MYISAITSVPSAKSGWMASPFILIPDVSSNSASRVEVEHNRLESAASSTNTRISMSSDFYFIYLSDNGSLTVSEVANNLYAIKI